MGCKELGPLIGGWSLQQRATYTNVLSDVSFQMQCPHYYDFSCITRNINFLTQYMFKMFWLTRLEVALFGRDRVSEKIFRRRARRVEYILKNADNPKKLTKLIRNTPNIVNDVIASNSEQGNQALALLLKNGVPSRTAIRASFFRRGRSSPYVMAYWFCNWNAFQMLCDHGVETNDSAWIRRVRVSVLQYLVMQSPSYNETCVDMILLFVSRGATIAEIPKRISHLSRNFVQESPRYIMACAEGGYMYHERCCYSCTKFRSVCCGEILSVIQLEITRTTLSNGNKRVHFSLWEARCTRNVCIWIDLSHV